MQSINYRSGKMVFGALCAVGLAMLCGWLWVANDSAYMGLAAFAFGACAVMGVRNSFISRPVLQFDDRTIEIDKLFGSVKLGWKDVQKIWVEQITMRYMGIIPVSKQQFLVIRADGGMFGSTNHRLAASTMALPAGGIGALCALLTAAHVAAVGVTGVAMKGAGERGWGADTSPSLARVPVAPSDEDPVSSDFDADAAIARYLAQKQAAAEPQPAPGLARPARPSFGRRGL